MKKVSFYLMALFCIMLGFTACSNTNEPEGEKQEEGNMKRVAAAFYYGEGLFEGMNYFSLRFTTETLDLNADPVVGSGEVVVLDIFSECLEDVIFPKAGTYQVVNMERVENGYAMAGANYQGSNLGCYIMYAEDGKPKADANGNTGDFITSGTIKIEGTPENATVIADVKLEITGETKNYKYVGPLTIKDLSE